MTRLRQTNTDALDKITHIMPEPPLDDDQRHTLARHLDSVSMPELMRGQPPTHPGRDRGVA